MFTFIVLISKIKQDNVIDKFCVFVVNNSQL